MALNELTSATDRDRFTGVPWHKAVPCRVERVLGAHGWALVLRFTKELAGSSPYAFEARAADGTLLRTWRVTTTSGRGD